MRCSKMLAGKLAASQNLKKISRKIQGRLKPKFKLLIRFFA
jgi:hypothetical protein